MQRAEEQTIIAGAMAQHILQEERVAVALYPRMKQNRLLVLHAGSCGERHR